MFRQFVSLKKKRRKKRRRKKETETLPLFKCLICIVPDFQEICTQESKQQNLNNMIQKALFFFNKA